MTNQTAMTLEARIAQKLKEDTLGQLLTEDELSEIIARAVNDIIGERPLVPNPRRGYNEPANVPSHLTYIQTWACEQAKPLIEAYVVENAEELRIKETIELAVKACLPELVLQCLTHYLIANLGAVAAHVINNTTTNDANDVWLMPLAIRLRERMSMLP